MIMTRTRKLSSSDASSYRPLPSVLALAISVTLCTFSSQSFSADNHTVITVTKQNGDGLLDYQDADSSPVLNDEQSAEQQGEGTQNDSPVHPDRDADGVANQNDLDDDNDTILDTEEGIIDADGDGVADASSRDTDGDGTPDGNDLDSDNDGILDILEARLTDDIIATLDVSGSGAVSLKYPVGSNGVPDIIETSADSGTINEPLFDTDADGILDFVDIDSDNDGISDLVEAGGVDENSDGRVDSFSDADDKGVDDAIQAGTLPRFDTDGDGMPDYRDTDSDADTIADAIEGAGNLQKPTDSDGDGAADYREQDSDNDGVADAIEVGPDVSVPVDTNGDGIPDFQDAAMQYTGTGNPVDPSPVDPQDIDHDGDGQIDSQDSDDDNDGISDEIEGSGDSDSDGILNRLDRDSDNDGVLDSQEGMVDSDGDLVPDFLDLDSDNDGVFDSLESLLYAAISDNGRLASAVSVDSFGVASGAGSTPLDTDKDGIPDRLDLDSDNDGLPDLHEAGYSDTDLNARLDNFIDANGDGADDSMTSNAAQLRDSDMDRIPDIRDLDSDQDGLSDLSENLGFDIDQNSDGKVDNFTDANADGIDDTIAALLMNLTDTDGDRLPDSIDLDSDGDGITDLEEVGGMDADNNGQIDILNDKDGDGITDSNDVDNTGGNDADSDGIDDAADSDYAEGPDTDGDGVVDSADPDANGDGFAGPFDDDGSNSPSQGKPLELPDTDSDGVPDIQQQAANRGSIETGLDGSGFGCSIATVGNMNRPDPMAALLIGGSTMFLGMRFVRRRATGLKSAQPGARASNASLSFKTTAAVVVGASVLSGCSLLDSVSDRNFGNRVYAGAGVLASRLEPDTDGVEGTSVSDSQSAGASATVGYDLNNRFSVEAHLADLGEAELSPEGSVGYTVAGVSGLLYGLNDEGDRDHRAGFSVFGKMGLGTLSNDAKSVEYHRVNDVHLLAGVGMEYGLENGLGLRAEVTAHETDAKYAQLGMVYRFGDASDMRARNARSGSVVSTPSIPSPGLSTRTQTATPVPVPPKPAAVPTTGTLADTDGDGVVNGADKCSGTAAGVPVKADGCPVFNGVIEGIEFESGSANLTADAVKILEGVAQTLRDYPDIDVTVEAHTDNLGGAAANLQLSKRRAIAVASHLVKRGITGTRLKPQAFGESRPRVSNETRAGRAANRRVEFSILK